MNPFRIFAKFGQSILMTILSILLVIFYFSYIVAAIWLLILGNWVPLLQGIIFSLFSSWVYSVLLLPAMGLGILVGFFGRKNELAAQFFSLLAILYQNAIMIFWVYYIFKIFLSWETPKNFIPLLILSYNVAMGVFCFMAKGEDPDSLGTNLGLFLAFVTCLTMIFMLLFTGFSFIPLIIIYVLFSIFQFVMVMLIQQESEIQS